jgi:hypothetical protein
MARYHPHKRNLVAQNVGDQVPLSLQQKKSNPLIMNSIAALVMLLLSTAYHTPVNAKDRSSPVTREYLVGSWGTDGCKPPAVVYSQDGTTDEGSARWSLKGGQLVVVAEGTRTESVVERLGRNRMRLNTADGPFDLTRCR